jgi:hypothetical protein
VVRRRASLRKWRVRARRAQVAPVATILGLLVVVTFIANYLSTTLPNQMSVNDLNRELLVENQLGRLQALLEDVALAGAVGAPVSVPVTLGSAGDPPFAGADGGSVSLGYQGTNATFNYSVAGAASFQPPVGFGVTHVALPSTAGCSPSSPTTSLTCTNFDNAQPLRWNFSAGNGLAYTVSLQGGSTYAALNFSTNSSTIALSGVEGFSLFVTVYGSGDTITFPAGGSGGNTPLEVNISGNDDSLSFTGITGNGNDFVVHVFGNSNVVDGPGNVGGNAMWVSVIGRSNTVSLTPGRADTYSNYFTGFDSGNATSAACPYGSLGLTNLVNLNGASARTLEFDRVHVGETFNNSSAYNSPSTHTLRGSVTFTNATAATFACPGVTQALTPLRSATNTAALVAHLANTYAPVAEVAFDQGAVVYAQSGGYPVVLDPPGVNITAGHLRIWLPSFVGASQASAGTGTVTAMFRLLAVQSLNAPSGTFGVPSAGIFDLVVSTPYAAGWVAYFSSLAGFPATVSCAPSASVACTGPYASGGPLGNVTVAISTGGLSAMTITLAQYSVSFT